MYLIALTILFARSISFHYCVDNFALCTLSCVYIGITFVMKAMVFMVNKVSILFVLKFVAGHGMIVTCGREY